MNIVGLDVGGANIKAADANGGSAQQHPFALWKNPNRLDAEIASVLESFGQPDKVALTMTGELCDCFESKADGVRHIAAAVQRAAPNVTVRIWTIDGEFISPHQCDAEPHRAAASNWLALATFVGKMARTGSAILIDLGSTTCDIVPLYDGKPQPRGRTDSARLLEKELLYCGVRRTPLCAILGLSAAAEFFATTEDVYVTLGDLPEEPHRTDTADGRPLTKAHCRARLARMQCDEGWSIQQAKEFARDVRNAQTRWITQCARSVASSLPGPLLSVVYAGVGEFLIRDALAVSPFCEAQLISLADMLGPALSTGACALAVARLAAAEES